MPNQQEPGLTIIIPMYNEQHRIGETLLDLAEQVRALGVTVELIAVSDGSSDHTEEVVSQAFDSFDPNVFTSHTLVSFPKNKGKGAAVLEGFRRATGERVLFMDADNATTIREFSKLNRAAAEGADLAIASRALATSEVEAKLTRRMSGRTYKLALRLMGFTLARDTQCGFKLYSRSLAKYLADHAREQRFAFDIEHLAIAQQLGLSIQEVGVKWTHVDGGTVRVISDGIAMLRSARAIAKRLRRTPHEPKGLTPYVMVERKPAVAPTTHSTAIHAAVV